MGTLDRSRLGVAAQAVGIAQGATDYAAAYAQERQQFGKPIAAFQGIQFKLADMESRTAAARELLYRACSKIDAGDADMGKYSAMAKLIASDTAMWVTTEAVQVLGGYGYVNEYPVERMMRDAKITQIYEGTNEIQRLVIARTLSRRAKPPSGGRPSVDRGRRAARSARRRTRSASRPPSRRRPCGWRRRSRPAPARRSLRRDSPIAGGARAAVGERVGDLGRPCPSGSRAGRASPPGATCSARIRIVPSIAEAEAGAEVAHRLGDPGHLAVAGRWRRG